MSLKSIDLEEFESYNFERFTAFIFATEKYWFSDDQANIIGTVLRDKIDHDWSYVIMGLDEDDEYRAISVDASIETEIKAIEQIKTKMAAIANKGKTEQSLYKSSLFDSKSSIIITDINEEIKRFFKKYPQKLYEINPRNLKN